METNKVGINELDKNLMELSAIFKTILEPDFENIGIELEEFLVRKINLIEDDPKFEKLKTLYDSEFEDAVLEGGTRRITKETRSEQMVTEVKRELMEEEQKTITSKTKAELERELLIAQAEADKIRILGQANAEIERIKNADKVPDSDKKLCKSCGKELLPNARFCLECGKKVEDEETINCPSCGAKAPKGKFCIVCGMELTPKCPTCGRELPTGAKFCLDC